MILPFNSIFTKLLNDINFTNNDDLKSHLLQFFADNDKKFYETKTMKLPERCQKVIEQYGTFIS